MTPYSAGYRRVVVLLLTAAYTFNSMDRSIISILAPSIKADLQLTDTQLGLLGGTAFALLYGLGGLPIARLAERVSRVNIMTVALIAWSSLTAMCALAASFGQLLLIRAGVGIAEAGCSPSAHSLISDYVAPSRRASALSIYTCGISLGYILAAVLGGYLAQHAGWRMACAAVGLPGILTALIIKGAVREPPRGGVDAPGVQARIGRARTAAILDASRVRRTSCSRVGVAFRSPHPAHGARAHPRGLRRVRFLLLHSRLFSPRVRARCRLGRAHQRRLGRLGRGARDSRGRRSFRFPRTLERSLVRPGSGHRRDDLAAVSMCSRWSRRDGKVPRRRSPWAGFFWYASLGPTFGVVQNVVDARRRATATAFLYICLSMLALGLGPLFVGWVIDRFAESSFAASGTAHSFRETCPGGTAVAGAAVTVQEACRSALALGSRRGLLLTVGFFAWAVGHYFLAAFGLKKTLTGRR